MKLVHVLQLFFSFKFCMTSTSAQENVDGYDYQGNFRCNNPGNPANYGGYHEKSADVTLETCKELCDTTANCEYFTLRHNLLNKWCHIVPTESCINVTANEQYEQYKKITSNSGGGGDPHFKTWADERYDYHGICDLVLLKNPHFASGVGMDINIRTKQIHQWSYISNAAIRIGDDIFEVEGDSHHGSSSHYWHNGLPVTSGAEESTTENDDLVMLPMTLSGYPILHRRSNSQKNEFFVDLGNGEKIHVTSWKKLVGVHVEGATTANFGGSSGLLGSFGSGQHLARDGMTVIEDVNTFGEEWQVLASEDDLFRNSEGPQHPDKCIAPSTTTVRRRLQDSHITEEMADIACSRVNSADHDICVFDVMATNDLDTAGAY